MSSANLTTTTNVVTIGTSAYYVANGNVGIGNTTPNATLQVQGNANVSGNAVIGGTILINNIITAYANSYTFSNSIAAANIDVFSSSTYRSAEYTLQLYDTTLATPAFEITKILIIHDNSNNTYMTEFGQIYNSQLLGTFTSGITAGNLYLQLTPTTANVVCKFIRNTFAWYNKYHWATTNTKIDSIEYGDLIMDEELENPTTNNQSQQEIPNIVLTLNVNDVNLVLNALQELPHKIVDKVLQNIFAQAQSQLQQKQ